MSPDTLPALWSITPTLPRQGGGEEGLGRASHRLATPRERRCPTQGRGANIGTPAGLKEGPPFIGAAGSPSVGHASRHPSSLPPCGGGWGVSPRGHPRNEATTRRPRRERQALGWRFSTRPVGRPRGRPLRLRRTRGPAHPGDAASPLQRRAAGVPGGGLLIGVGGPQHRGLVEGAPRQWQPHGQPALVKPLGTLTVGRPERLTGRVPWSSTLRASTVASPARASRWPTGGAGTGTAGVASTSTRSRARARSPLTRVRTRWPFW